MEQYWMMADTEIGEESWEDFEEWDEYEDEDEVLSPEELEAIAEGEWEQMILERKAEDLLLSQWDDGGDW